MAKSKLWIFLLIAASLLVVSIVFMGGCTGESSTEEPSPPVLPVTPTQYSSISIPIEEFPNHPHIDVVMHAVVGEELVVTLGSNPTTGFGWSEEAEISNESVVQQIDHMFVGPGIEEPPVAPPVKRFGLSRDLRKVLPPYIWKYSRPWIEEEIGYWTVTITATIK